MERLFDREYVDQVIHTVAGSGLVTVFDLMLFPKMTLYSSHYFIISPYYVPFIEGKAAQMPAEWTAAVNPGRELRN